MPEKNRLHFLELSTENILPDALMNSILLITVIGYNSMLLVSGNDKISRYFISWLLIIPAVLLFILRRSNLLAIPMTLMHFAVLIIPVLIFGRMGFDVLITAFSAGIILAAYSLTAKFRPVPTSPSIPLLILSICVHLYCLIGTFMRNTRSLTPYIFAGLCMCICLYLAAWQLQNFQKNFNHFLTSQTQPGRQISANNSKIVILLCLCVIIIFPVSIVFPYGSIVNFLKIIGSRIIAFILYLFKLVPSANGESEETVPSYTGGRNAEYEFPSFGILIQILEIIIFIGLILFGIFCLYKLVIAAAKYLRSHYRRSKSTSINTGSLYVIDEVINLNKITERQKRKPPAFGTGEERKIRKKYFHTVKEAISKGAKISGSFSTEEIRKAVLEVSGKDITELTHQYEEARYGNHTDSTPD